MKDTRIIIITGGIGCGKSVVTRLLHVMGYPTYDCDQEAKRLMTEDPELRQQLICAFGPETYLEDGALNKAHLSALIFNDKTTLQKMDAIVHPAVGRDIIAHLSEHNAPLFVETAIYYEAEFGRFIAPDQVWCVASPLELRIGRAMKRDNTSREKILARINSQMSQEEKIQKADAVIWNDDTHSIISQVNALL